MLVSRYLGKASLYKLHQKLLSDDKCGVIWEDYGNYTGLTLGIMQGI